MAHPTDIFRDENPERSIRTASAMTRAFVQEAGLADHPTIKDLEMGLTMAQSMGLTRDDLDVIYAMGFQKLTGADFKAAEDVFAYLVMIDPLHAPNHYCLGVSRQAQARHDEAEMAFLGFLAMDATNPVGYLRLGECRQAQGDRKMALEAFSLAEAECLKGHGDTLTLQEARAKRALVDQEQPA